MLLRLHMTLLLGYYDGNTTELKVI